MPQLVRHSQEGIAIASIDHRRARRKTSPGKSSRAAANAKPLVSCKKEVDFIVRYIAAQLNAAEQSGFQAHLDACPDCAAFLQTYKKTIEITRSFLQVHASTEAPHQLTLRR
ncbi:MAG TPA: zf-HC2 domain-containing protein [Candidatus Limnocylindria bacterium]|nr:zf-HC2 domain-containing protein [Candidatus Limnocylindria bacterium]